MNFRKRHWANVAARILFAFVFLFFTYHLKAQITVNIDKPKASFAVKERMYFRLSSPVGGSGSFEMYYDPRNANSVIQKGSFNLQPGRDTFIFYSHAKPGVIFFKATLNGVTDIQTVAFEPLSIAPAESEPADFDQFWQKQKASLATVPMNPKLSQINTLGDGSKVYLLELGNVDNRKVYGYLSVPSGSGKFPAVLTMPPYGNAPFQPESLVTTDFTDKGKAISLIITIHNAPPNQIDPNAYFPDDIENPEKMYTRWMVLAGIRAIDYLTSRSDFNGSLGLCGLSQGGGLALMVAGLDSRVSALIASNPAHCEHQAWRYKQASGFPLYMQRAVNSNFDTLKVVKSIKYHDASYFIKRYKNPLLLLIGYEDDVTPAATVFTALNQHRGISTVLHMQNVGHNYPWNEYWLGRFAFFKQHLKGFANPFSFQKGFTISAGNDFLNINDFKVTLQGQAKIENSVNNNINYNWAQVDGPGKASFFTPNSATTVATFSKPGTYTLKLCADYEYLIDDKNDSKYYTLTDYITVQVNKATAADDLKKSESIKIAPNPSVDRAKIQWDADLNIQKLEVYSLEGRLFVENVIPPFVNEYDLDLTTFNSGIFLLKLIDKNGAVLTKKLFKTN